MWNTWAVSQPTNLFCTKSHTPNTTFIISRGKKLSSPVWNNCNPFHWDWLWVSHATRDFTQLPSIFGQHFRGKPRLHQYNVRSKKQLNEWRIEDEYNSLLVGHHPSSSDKHRSRKIIIHSDASEIISVVHWLLKYYPNARHTKVSGKSLFTSVTYEGQLSSLLVENTNLCPNLSSIGNALFLS